ncbi:MAG TPA: DUF411 domain-containing protein, partial [Giesbergeria sp.]|nr:DUF411 domain-containing protein [Giesbergeria sp.]
MPSQPRPYLRSLPRRQWLTTALPLLGAGVAAITWPRWSQAATPQGTPVELWKDPSCGCCHDWVTHMEAAGFQFKVHDIGNTGARARLGLPHKLGSCHTALV